MKNRICTLLIAALLFNANLLQAQTDDKAFEYFEELAGPFFNMKKETWQYLKAVTKGKKARKVDKKRQKLLQEIKSNQSQVKKVRPYQSDAILKKAVVDYLDISYSVIKEDYDKILDMEDIAEQSYDLMEAYLLAQERAGEKLDSAFSRVQLAQKKFAAQYNINLVEGEDDKITQKIRSASDALKYYNEVYLIFFKSYKQEAYVLNASQNNDVSGLEQNTSTLASFTEEGLGKLKSIANYKGDSSLKTAAQQLLKFYKTEAEKDFPAMVDFYIKRDNFEKLSKAIESKGKKDITKEEIERYNQATNEYNEAVNSFNQINGDLHAKRSKHLENWNQSVSKFFDTHSN